MANERDYTNGSNGNTLMDKLDDWMDKAGDKLGEFREKWTNGDEPREGYSERMHDRADHNTTDIRDKANDLKKEIDREADQYEQRIDDMVDDFRQRGEQLKRQYRARADKAADTIERRAERFDSGVDKIQSDLEKGVGYMNPEAHSDRTAEGYYSEHTSDQNRRIYSDRASLHAENTSRRMEDDIREFDQYMEEGIRKFRNGSDSNR